jgi:hypothetical protein
MTALTTTANLKPAGLKGLAGHSGPCIRRPHSEVAGNGEDLVNAAAAEPQRHGGQASEVLQDGLPAGQPVAAILQYYTESE